MQKIIIVQEGNNNIMKKYRRKLFLILITTFLILAFTGCGKKDDSADAQTQTYSQTDGSIEDSVSVLPAGEDARPGTPPPCSKKRGKTGEKNGNPARIRT